MSNEVAQNARRQYWRDAFALQAEQDVDAIARADFDSFEMARQATAILVELSLCFDQARFCFGAGLFHEAVDSFDEAAPANFEVVYTRHASEMQ